MLFVKNVKIGQNRGAPRVWLEGKALAEAGFVRGQSYELIERDDGSLLLCLHPEGSYRVSGKSNAEPVIDLNSQKVLARFKDLGDMLRVSIGAGVVHLSARAVALRLKKRLARLAGNLAAGFVTTASLAGGGGVMASAMASGLLAGGLQAQHVMHNEIREDLVEHAMTANPATRARVTFNLGLQEVAFDPALLKRVPQCDVLEMGLPCSGASIAGKSKNKLSVPENHQGVGHLIAGAIAIAAQANPAAIVLENVVPYEASGSAAILRNTLSEWGYQVQERVFFAPDFGDLEARSRYVMVAVSEGLTFDLEDVRPGVYAVRKLSDIMDPSEVVAERWSPMEGLKAKEIRDREAGKGFAMQIYDGSESRIATLTKGIGKNRSTDPKFRHPTDPGLLRIPTAREHARAKGIPVALIEGLSQTVAHEMLGQSICWGMMTALFEALSDGLRSVDTDVSMATLASKVAA